MKPAYISQPIKSLYSLCLVFLSLTATGCSFYVQPSYNGKEDSDKLSERDEIYIQAVLQESLVFPLDLNKLDSCKTEVVNRGGLHDTVLTISISDVGTDKEYHYQFFKSTLKKDYALKYERPAVRKALLKRPEIWTFFIKDSIGPTLFFSFII